MKRLLLIDEARAEGKRKKKRSQEMRVCAFFRKSIVLALLPAGLCSRVPANVTRTCVFVSVSAVFIVVKTEGKGAERRKEEGECSAMSCMYACMHVHFNRNLDGCMVYDGQTLLCIGWQHWGSLRHHAKDFFRGWHPRVQRPVRIGNGHR
jgi:hypothetical protein